MTKDAIQEIESLVTLAHEPTRFEDGAPFVVLAANTKVQSVQHLMPRPARKVGTVTMHRPESFCRYYKEYAKETSRIYADGRAFIGVLDHSEADKAAWEDHRVVYPLKQSPEWAFWTGKNGVHFAQKDFCTLIEDHLDDYGNPTGADMLEMVTSLEAASNVSFKGAVRDGKVSRIEYVHESTAKIGAKDKVELIREFQLFIPAWEGGVKSALVARLRFDITGGRLMLWYELVNVAKALEEQLDLVTVQIEDASKAEIFFGTPAVAASEE